LDSHKKAEKARKTETAKPANDDSVEAAKTATEPISDSHGLAVPIPVTWPSIRDHP
jgi:hypothetical protein